MNLSDKLQQLILRLKYRNRPAPLPKREQNENNRWLVIDYASTTKKQYDEIKGPWTELRPIGVVMQINNYNEIHNTEFSIDDVYGKGHYDLIEKERLRRIDYPEIHPLVSSKDYYWGYDKIASDYNREYTNDFGVEGIRFHHYLTHLADNDISLDADIRSMMDAVNIKEPIKLHIANKAKGLDCAASSLYVKEHDAKWPRDSDLYRYIECAPNCRAAWQIYLLTKSAHILPMSGLGIWGSQYKYLFSLEDLKSISIFRTLDLDSKLAKSFLPSVSIVENIAVVRCYYWNKSIGLTQEKFTIEFEADKIKSIKTQDFHVSDTDGGVENLRIHAMLGKSVRVVKPFNIGYLIHYSAPFTGAGEVKVNLGEVFTSLSTMRDDAFYAKCVNQELYEIAEEKALSETNENLKARLGGVSFFLTVEQIRNYCVIMYS